MIVPTWVYHQRGAHQRISSVGQIAEARPVRTCLRDRVHACDEAVQAVRARYADRRIVGSSCVVRSSACLFPMRPHAKCSQALALFGALGMDTAPLAARLAGLQSVAMRLELRDGINGCRIVNDSYNSDINSLAIALEYLSTVAGDRAKTLILSDIDQSGLAPAELYARVAELVRTTG
ncbi:MAG: hypothetical protein ACLT1W_11835 [Alistipes onderdonkii]